MSDINDSNVIRSLKNMPEHELNKQQESAVIEKLHHNIKKSDHRKKWTNTTLYITTFVGAAALLFFFLSPILFQQLESNSISSHPLESYEGELSPTFDLYDQDGSIVFENGVRGIDGKVGYREVLGENFVAEDERKGGKMFWYVWGKPDELRGEKLVATATHNETGESFQLDDVVLSGSLYGEDAHALTSFAPFPDDGVWEIDVKIGNLDYGQIVVYVKSPYPKSDNITYMISEEDIITGDTLSITAEIDKVVGEPSLEAVLVEKNTGEEKQITFKHLTDFVGASMYEGEIKFDQVGEWEIHLHGETTSFQVNEARSQLE